MNTENTSTASPAFGRSAAPELPGTSPLPLHPHANQARASEGRRRSRHGKFTLPATWESVPFGDALPLNDFRKDLEREKRRSDRSKAPLSLALFQLDDDPRRTLSFLKVVHRVTRETDVVGHVGNDMIALLCPDTDSDGIRSALRKIEAGAQGLDVKAHRRRSRTRTCCLTRSAPAS